ncbi:MAG TPA: hypothetical protein VLS45_05475 [Methylomicrobium sp.]|nr:hypothetical protein [Methylomicrobium sp.]
MYYVRFADLLTDVDLCEMSVPFRLDRRIVQPGAFSCDIDVSNAAVGSSIAKIIPQRTICHVYRGNMIIGSYIIWTKTLSSSSGSVKCSLQGATLESYLYSRITPTLSYSGVDQITIAEDLIAAAQTYDAPYSSNADLGITVVSSPSGVLRDREYFFADGKFIGDSLAELASVDDGFEYVIQTMQDGDVRTRTMHIGYPGIAGSSNPFVIEEPGSITEWKIVYDGTNGWDVFWSRGSQAADDGSGPVMSSPYVSIEYLQNGFPILEHMSDYSSVTLITTLDQYSKWWSENRSGPLFIPSFSVDANRMFASGFSPGLLGHQFNYIMSNPAFPLVNGVPSMSGGGRMIGFELNVDSSERATMNILIETSFDPTDVV